MSAQLRSKRVVFGEPGRGLAFCEVQPKVKVAPPQPEPESVPPKVRMGKVYAEEDHGGLVTSA